MQRSSSQANAMQFGIRDLFLTVTVAAILAAAIAPWLRSLDAESQQLFIIRLALFIFGACGGLLARRICRIVLAKRYGDCHLVVYSRTRSLGRWLRPMSALVFLTLFLWVSTFIFMPWTGNKLTVNAWFIIPFFGIMASRHIAWLARNRLSQRFDFYERGIAAGDARFRGWDTFRHFHWNRDNSRLFLRGKNYSFWNLNINVPPEQHAEVDQLVRQFLPEEQFATNARQK